MSFWSFEIQVVKNLLLHLMNNRFANSSSFSYTVRSFLVFVSLDYHIFSCKLTVLRLSMSRFSCQMIGDDVVRSWYGIDFKVRGDFRISEETSYFQHGQDLSLLCVEPVSAFGSMKFVVGEWSNAFPCPFPGVLIFPGQTSLASKLYSIAKLQLPLIFFTIIGRLICQ